MKIHMANACTMPSTSVCYFVMLAISLLFFFAALLLHHLSSSRDEMRQWIAFELALIWQTRARAHTQPVTERIETDQ